MITLMDPAVMRNGRLDQLVYIPMPDLEARKAIFRANLRKTPIADNVNTDLLAEHTEGYSGGKYFKRRSEHRVYGSTVVIVIVIFMT